ncbi:hypothetical protein ACFFRR_010286 [Megaselia abdita]
MSLIPFLMEIAHEIGEMNRGIDDNFGFGIYPHEIHSRPSCGNRNKLFWVPPKHRLHPYENLRKKNCCPKLQKEKSFDEDDGEIVKSSSAAVASSEVTNTPTNGFQVSVNVQQFKPNELTVKVVDNHVVVDGRHEERFDEHGLISRQFQRKYLIPKGIDSKFVTSSLSSDGILTVKAPPPVKASREQERFIEIQHTGPAHLTVKDNNGHAEPEEDMSMSVDEPQKPKPQKTIPIETNGNGQAAAEEVKEAVAVAPPQPVETTIKNNSEPAAAAPAAIVTAAAKKCEENVVVAAATNTTTTTNEDTTTQTPKISVVAVAAQTQPGQCENGGTDTPIATAAAATATTPIEAAN